MPLNRFVIPAALVAAALAGCVEIGRPSATALAPIGQLRTQGLSLADIGPSRYKAYHGITHTHVAENGDDGQGTLSEAYEFARQRAKLDFLAVSSHSHMVSDQGYRVMKAASQAFTENGKFVALLAQEWSSISKGGHINIFEASERCPLPNGAWDDFYQHWLPNHPEVAWIQFNHPHPSNPLEFGGSGFSPVSRAESSVAALDKFAGMALLNGPGKYVTPDMKGEPDEWDRGVNRLNYELEYLEFLNRGWRIGPLGDQDNHVKNWGLAVPTRTGIWARNLTREGVVEALQARRTFAAFDPNVHVWMSVDGVDMGSTVTGGKPLEAVIEAADPDTAFARLELFADMDGVGGKPAQVVARQPVGAKAAQWRVKLPEVRSGSYVFAKVVYDETRAWAWTSPIWVAGEARQAQRRR